MRHFVRHEHAHISADRHSHYRVHNDPYRFAHKKTHCASNGSSDMGTYGHAPHSDPYPCAHDEPHDSSNGRPVARADALTHICPDADTHSQAFASPHELANFAHICADSCTYVFAHVHPNGLARDVPRGDKPRQRSSGVDFGNRRCHL